MFKRLEFSRENIKVKIEEAIQKFPEVESFKSWRKRLFDDEKIGVESTEIAFEFNNVSLEEPVLTPVMGASIVEMEKDSENDGIENDQEDCGEVVVDVVDKIVNKEQECNKDDKVEGDGGENSEGNMEGVTEEETVELNQIVRNVVVGFTGGDSQDNLPLSQFWVDPVVSNIFDRLAEGKQLKKHLLFIYDY